MVWLVMSMAVAVVKAWRVGLLEEAVQEIVRFPLAVGKRRPTEQIANSLRRLRLLTEGRFDV